MEIANFSGKRVLICCINKSYEELFEKKSWRKEKLDCVNKYWDIPNLEKANNVDYIIGYYGNPKIIVVVAKLGKYGWQKVSEIEKLRQEEPVLKNKDYLNRYAFIGGQDISDLSEGKIFINKIVPSHIKFPQFSSKPIYCVNNEVVEW